MKLYIVFFFLLVGCSSPYQDLHDSLDETLEIIDSLYPEKPSHEKLRQGMLHGLIQGVDAHGAYLNETQIRVLRQSSLILLKISSKSIPVLSYSSLSIFKLHLDSKGITDGESSEA